MYICSETPNRNGCPWQVHHAAVGRFFLRKVPAMYCNLCHKPIDPLDKYHIDGYVNTTSGIPQNIYVHANGACPNADIEMFTAVCPTCKKVFETYDRSRIYCSATCANHERYETTINVIRDKYIERDEDKRALIDKLKDDMKQAATDLRAEMAATRSQRHHSTKAPRPESIQPQVTGAMRAEPVEGKVDKFVVRNEQGVVWMFSRMARMVGWNILDIRTAFPDATFVNAAGQRLEVEFEYRASNFIAHGHDAAKCDFVVCWNADTGIDGVEVLALDSL